MLSFSRLQYGSDRIVQRLFSSSTHQRAPLDDHVTAFRTMVDDANRHVLIAKSENTDTDAPDVNLDRYTVDWTKHWGFSSTTTLQEEMDAPRENVVILLPSTTTQVSQIVTYCYDNDISIVPQGGNTGLVGGGVPLVKSNHPQVILSTSRLNRIHSLSQDDGILHCQAGCILQDLQDYATKHNCLVPIDLGAKGTCQIGGNLSTNAGGIYYSKYGSLAANVLGLTCVLSDGSIVEVGSTVVRKDNTGYKIQQLMIGSEGTLGIITDVALSCPALPACKQLAVVACQSFPHVLQVVRMAKRSLGEILAAAEWMDPTIVKVVSNYVNGSQPNSSNQSTSLIFGDNVDTQDCHWLLIETHGSNEVHDAEKLHDFLEAAMSTTDGDESIVVDGVVAQDFSQKETFWNYRESCNPSVLQSGYTYKYDLSLSVSEFDDFVRAMKTENTALSDMASSGYVVQTNWGHVLDGNIHFNLTTPGVFEKDDDVLACLEPYIFDEVTKRRGSISAEHGLGQEKFKYLPQIHSEATLSLMRDMKRLMDPKGILNPSKFLPP